VLPAALVGDKASGMIKQAVAEQKLCLCFTEACILVLAGLLLLQQLLQTSRFPHFQ
jgi:hypothetical protein